MWWRCDARAKIAAAAAAPSQHLGLACVVDSPNILKLTFCRKTLINTKFVSFIGPMITKMKGVSYVTYIASQNPMSLSNGSAVWSILAQFNSFNDLSTFLALNWFYSIIALYSLFCTSYQPETVACMHKELINETSNNTISTFLWFSWESDTTHALLLKPKHCSERNIKTPIVRTLYNG